MNIKTNTGWMGLLLALSTLSTPTTATAATTESPSAIAIRLSRITATLREREAQLSEALQPGQETAIGWGNGGGNRGFVNTRRGGWGDGHRGGFANINPWRNGWGDRGGFFNSRPWGNGGGFFNNPGGGFFNR